jgi:archaellum component FlaC
MDIFGRKNRELQKKLESMDQKLKASFSRVRQDMQAANAWITYYHQRSLHLENQLSELSKNSQKIDEKITKSHALHSSVDKHSAMIEALSDHISAVRHEIASLKSQLPKNLSLEKLNFYIENISKQFSHLSQRVEQISYLHDNVESLKQQLSRHTASPEHTRANELTFHIEKISNDLAKLEQKLGELAHLPSKVDHVHKQFSEHLAVPHSSHHIDKRIDDIQEKLSSIVVKKSPKDKLVQKVTKNSHDYIKAVVLGYIRKYEKVTGFQLREIVVEEQNLTSKSSFYRILEEIEREQEDVTVVKDGKEKVYYSNLKKAAYKH